MKRLFKTFSIFCLACVLLSACSQQPPDTAPVQEPVQDGAVEEAPVYVYLTRHGQTLTNQTGRFVSGRGNTPLTEEGRKVAYAVGLGLSGVKFEAAYASTLGRTQETARIILSQSQTSRDLEIIPVEDLKEVDGGSYEPMSYAELMTDEGMQFSGVTTEEFTNQFHEKDPEGLAESYEQMKDRAFESFQRICEERAQNGGGNILMVAHGGINSMIAAEIMQEQELEPLDNSSIVLIEYKDHTYTVLDFNDLSYAQKAQAAELGKALGNLEFAAVYASDQFKDIHTARIIVENSAVNPDLMVNQNMDLRGVGCGYFDGELRAVADALAGEEPTAHARLAAYAAADKTGMTENYESARQRLTGALQTICEETYSHGGGNVLVVSSELAVQLLAEALGSSEKAVALKNADVVHITFDGDVFTVHPQ